MLIFCSYQLNRVILIWYIVGHHHFSFTVDNAYACDPRIAKFKEEEKARKLAQKKAKQDAARQRAEEEERVRLHILSKKKLSDSVPLIK